MVCVVFFFFFFYVFAFIRLNAESLKVPKTFFSMIEEHTISAEHETAFNLNMKICAFGVLIYLFFLYRRILLGS